MRVCDDMAALLRNRVHGTAREHRNDAGRRQEPHDALAPVGDGFVRRRRRRQTGRRLRVPSFHP
jgi:hypothetical protein